MHMVQYVLAVSKETVYDLGLHDCHAVFTLIVYAAQVAICRL